MCAYFPVSYFFSFFSFPTFYMFVIAYLPRWLKLITKVTRFNYVRGYVGCIIFFTILFLVIYLLYC